MPRTDAVVLLIAIAALAVIGWLYRRASRDDVRYGETATREAWKAGRRKLRRHM
jgi:hypothetical protein